MAEGVELTAQVNALNTFLLALALLPKMIETRAGFPDARPHLTVVSFEAHKLEAFDEIDAPDLFKKMNRRNEYAQQKRYQVTKLMEVLLVRELVRRLEMTDQSWDLTEPPVIVNLVNPGLCASTLGQGENKPPLAVRMLRSLLDRTLDVDARCYVHAAAAPASLHGKYIADGKNQEVEAWILTDVGAKVQRKVWDQTMRVLEQRKPGILKDLGLRACLVFCLGLFLKFQTCRCDPVSSQSALCQSVLLPSVVFQPVLFHAASFQEVPVPAAPFRAIPSEQ